MPVLEHIVRLARMLVWSERLMQTCSGRRLVAVCRLCTPAVRKRQRSLHGPRLIPRAQDTSVDAGPERYAHLILRRDDYNVLDA